MAFGSWFKGLAGKIKNGFDKAKKFVVDNAPRVVDAAQKVGGFLANNAGNIASAVGNAVGGEWGQRINNAGDKLQQIGNNVYNYSNRAGEYIKNLK